MRVQDFMADQTEWAVGNFYRNVKRVPSDKVGWKVLETGRTVLDQAQEVAMSPKWTLALLSGKGAFDWNPESMAAMQAEMAEWTTVDRCEEVHKANLAELTAAMRAVKDDDLANTIQIPFTPEPVPMSTVLTFHYWNVVYHLGQVLFIQTLYGDNEMVF